MLQPTDIVYKKFTNHSCSIYDNSCLIIKKTALWSASGLKINRKSFWKSISPFERFLNQFLKDFERSDPMTIRIHFIRNILSPLRSVRYLCCATSSYTTYVFIFCCNCCQFAKVIDAPCVTDWQQHGSTGSKPRF